MDDYMSKPFTQVDLGEMIQRWIRRPGDGQGYLQITSKRGRRNRSRHHPIRRSRERHRYRRLPHWICRLLTKCSSRYGLSDVRAVRIRLRKFSRVF
jgi:hypothetical protein